MTISTADCKNFLVLFFSTNPQIIQALYITSSAKEIADMQAAATTITEWKREYRCRPGKGDYEFTYYTIYEPGCQLNRWAEPIDAPMRSTIDFAWERGFRLDSSEDGVKFVVLEDKDGNLFLGNYIGD